MRLDKLLKNCGYNKGVTYIIIKVFFFFVILTAKDWEIIQEKKFYRDREKKVNFVVR